MQRLCEDIETRPCEGTIRIQELLPDAVGEKDE